MINKNIFDTTAFNSTLESGEKLIAPFGPILFQSQIDKSYLNKLVDEGNKLTLEKNDWREKLAGNMKYGGSYIYNDDFILESEKYLVPYVERYFNGLIDRFGSTMIDKLMNVQVDRRAKKQGQLRLDTMWINYQHKHDFNPPHTHSGILSFVIFCKVPDRIFEEKAITNSEYAGKLIFNHTTTGSALDSEMYPISPYEGLMFIFPANLTHYVPAFWTDDERITVSGNFVAV